MQSQVKAATSQVLKQLIHLCSELNSEQFSKPLDLLSGNSIGKHVRHIVEFYDLLVDACLNEKVLSYDKREHCNETESSTEKAKSRIVKIQNWIQLQDTDKELQLEISYDNQNRENFSVGTSLERELIYNIEHAIHHMAIIRIAVEKDFYGLQLEPQFGIAYSTIRYRDDLCAH